MYPNWSVLLHLPLVCLGVAGQMFAQPLTKSPGILAIQRSEGQKIEEGDLQQHLQQITGTEALAPLLLNLVGQNVPNWQRQRQQQPQPPQQQATNQQLQQLEVQFFVYNKRRPVAASQQPRWFNGVNGVQPEQLPLAQAQQQQQPMQQQQQQYHGPKIVKAPPATAIWSPPELKQQHQNLAGGTVISTTFSTTLTVPRPHHSSPQTGIQFAGTQPPPSPHPAGPQAGSCGEEEVATPTGCAPISYETMPLLSVTALKAAVG